MYIQVLKHDAKFLYKYDDSFTYNIYRDMLAEQSKYIIYVVM